MQHLPKRIGHRGAMGYALENTLPSIFKALDLNVDGIEIDVRKCKSGELVVFHDDDLSRLSAESGLVSDYTLAELKQIPLVKQYTIPTLIEVLDAINKQCVVNIELKSEDATLECATVIDTYISKHAWEYAHFLVSGFNWNNLTKLHKINPKIPLAVLSENANKEAFNLAAQLNAVAVHINYNFITSVLIKNAGDLNLKVNAWTVNDRTEIKRLKQLGVCGIISDFPDRI